MVTEGPASGPSFRDLWPHKSSCTSTAMALLGFPAARARVRVKLAPGHPLKPVSAAPAHLGRQISESAHRLPVLVHDLRYGAPSVTVHSTKTSSTSNNCATMHPTSRARARPVRPPRPASPCQISEKRALDATITKRGIKCNHHTSTTLVVTNCCVRTYNSGRSSIIERRCQ